MMMSRLAAAGAITLALASSAFAQTAVEPTTTLPRTAPSSDTNAQSDSSTLPPGVEDPNATNSTTGTADHEDHCQPPGTPTNSNPTADSVTIPRADPACQ